MERAAFDALSAALAQDGIVITDRELGRGTFGLVLAAYHVRDPGTPLAVKLVHSVLREQSAHTMLAEIAMQKAASGVCEAVLPVLYEGDVAGLPPPCNAIHVIVTPAVPVTPFQHLVALATINDIRLYMFHLLLALAACQDLGIVHRDVKPRNFLYSATDGQGWLTDFGLAELESTIFSRAAKFAATAEAMQEAVDAHTGTRWPPPPERAPATPAQAAVVPAPQPADLRADLLELERHYALASLSGHDDALAERAADWARGCDGDAPGEPATGESIPGYDDPMVGRRLAPVGGRSAALWSCPAPVPIAVPVHPSIPRPRQRHHPSRGYAMAAAGSSDTTHTSHATMPGADRRSAPGGGGGGGGGGGTGAAADKGVITLRSVLSQPAPLNPAASGAAAVSGRWGGDVAGGPIATTKSAEAGTVSGTAMTAGHGPMAGVGPQPQPAPLPPALASVARLHNQAPKAGTPGEVEELGYE